MNLAQLRSGIERNKKGLAVAGVAGVAGLALMKRSKGDQPAAAGEDVPGAGAKYGMAPMATGAAGAYDSSASDVYNAIQPQLEDLGEKQGALDQLLKQLSEKINASPIPIAAPPPPPPPRPAPAPAPHHAPPAAPRVYTVVRGDNLTKIARNLGVGSWQNLYNANRGVIGGNPHLIKPGQQLVY